MANFTFVENDSGVQLQVTCTEGDNTTLIDLTQGSVLLRWIVDQQPGVVERPMVVVGDPTQGVVSYEFQTGELKGPLMTFEVQITDGAGKVRTSTESFKERVRDRLS
jgi:hypothetical protein